MGCSFPVAEIKFFIYIKNAELGGGGRNPYTDKTSGLRGKSDPNSSALIPAHGTRERGWP